MITSSLMVDHTKPLGKPRTAHLVLGFVKETKEFKGVMAVFSNDEKARKYIAGIKSEALRFEVEKRQVV